MSCFNHQETKAIGVCKNCGRLLCKECLAEELPSIACKSRCEKQVKAIDAFMEQSVITKCNTTSSAQFIGSILLMTLSVMLYQFQELEIYGIIIGTLGLFLFLNTLRTFKRKD